MLIRQGISNIIFFIEVNNYIPDLLNPSNIIKTDSFAKIWKHLPPVLKLRHWKLSYSNVIHGISLTT